MNNPEPNITVNVDVTNPGQFFACCGLLELADRFWPGAEGWFEQNSFHVCCGGNFSSLLSSLVKHPPVEITRLDCNGLEIKPIIAPLELSFDSSATPTMILDAWTKIHSVNGVPQVISNGPWNFWSGQQTSFGIWSSLRAVLTSQLTELNSHDLQDIFSQRVFQKGRFGFDPGAAWTALDAGFSPNEQGLVVESSAVVELLAAIGLQRFRPVVSDDSESFVYATWTQPFSPAVAAAAMAGCLPTRDSILLRGAVVSRGQYAALGESYLIRKGTANG